MPKGIWIPTWFTAKQKRKALQEIAFRFHGEGLRVFGREPLRKALENVLTDIGCGRRAKANFSRN